MSIYVSFRAAQKVGDDMEPVDDQELPDLSFFWSDIGDLIDGFREKLLEYDPTLQFDFFDNQGENGLYAAGALFRPDEIVETIQKIRYILANDTNRLRFFYLVVFPGYTGKPLSALGKLGVNGKEISLSYGLDYCYYTFVQGTSKSVDLRQYDSYTFEKLEFVNGNLVGNSTIEAHIRKVKLIDYYGELLKKIETYCAIAHRKSYYVALAYM